MERRQTGRLSKAVSIQCALANIRDVCLWEDTCLRWGVWWRVKYMIKTPQLTDLPIL